MDNSIRLVNDLRVDPANIPADFIYQVKAEFEKFTEGTAKEYRHEDKLRFVDLCVQRLRGNENEQQLVKRLILNTAEFKLDEYGDLPDVNDYNAIDFMEQCAAAGRESARLNFTIYGRQEKEKMRVLDLILTALYK